MTCSGESGRSRSVSSTRSKSCGRSRSRSRNSRRSYSHSSRSPSRSFSRPSSRSGASSRSRSRSYYSRSCSRSGRRRSVSWSRSRSHDHSTCTSRSRSGTRSRSRSGYRSGRRRSFVRSRSRSSYRSPIRSSSRSRSPFSPESIPLDAKCGNKDPRDRSKRVKWINNVWLVGEKAKDTFFHFCDSCDLPIVIYGRLLPCKHVLCYTCAMNLPSKCNRCHKSVQTVERCLVGGIFMCFENDVCRRTYLSQRDLQAHIDHRHRGGINSVPASSSSTIASATVSTAASLTSQPFEEQVRQIASPINAPNLVNFSNSNTISARGSVPKQSTGLTGCGLKFPSSQQNDGLLPFPTPTSTPNMILPNRLSGPVTHPIRSTIPNTFPQMPQFTTPPPLLTQRSVPPPTFLPSVLQAPRIPQNRNPTLNNPSAVAALAAVVSAALCAQSKPTGIVNHPDLGSLSTNQLQPNTLNSSLISNALRANNPSWANAITVTTNITNNSNASILANPLGNPNTRRLPF